MTQNKSNLKAEYQKIEIPKELDDAISLGIQRGKEEVQKGDVKMKKSRGLKNGTRGLVAAAAVVVVFGAGVNLSPAFADSMKDIPLLGTLVRTFQINEPKVEGGEVTDGTDISMITLEQKGDKENMIIDFLQKGEFAEMATRFTAEYKDYPATMTFTIPGARGMSAQAAFQKLKSESSFIKDIYPLVTLDDSMIRFVVEFKGSMNVLVNEYEDPGQIVVSMSTGEEKNETVYSVRTGSFENGENFAMMEELFMGREGIRILKDNNGKMFYEFAVCKTDQEAQALVDSINGENLGIRVFTEERMGNSQPSGFGEG